MSIGAGLWAMHWWRVLAEGERLFRRDLTTFTFSIKQTWLSRVESLELPQWTERIAGGMPYLADPANQTFYPLNALLLLGTDVWQSVSFFIIGHSALSILGFFILARAFGATPWLSLWGALIYGFAGYTLSITDNLNYMPAIALLPLVIGWYRRAIDADDRITNHRHAVGAGLALGAILLAGDLVSVSVVGGLAVVQWLVDWRNVRRHLTAGALMFAIAILLAAVQLWPAVELNALSVRAQTLEVAESMPWSFPPARLAELVHPAVLGDFQALETILSSPLYPARQIPWADTVYVGLLPVLLAVAAFARPHPGAAHVRRVDVRWLWASVAVVLYMSLGWHAPGAPELWRTFIALGTQRYPEKLLLVVTLLVVLLATIGAQRALNAAEDDAEDSAPMQSPLVRALGIVLMLAMIYALTLMWPMRELLGSRAGLVSGFWSARFGTPTTHAQGVLLHFAPFAVLIGWWAIDRARRRIAILVGLALCVADIMWMHHSIPETIDQAQLIDSPPIVAAITTPGEGQRPKIHFDRDGQGAWTGAGARALHHPQLTAFGNLARNAIDRLSPLTGANHGVDYWEGEWSPLQFQSHVISDHLGLANSAHTYLATFGVHYVLTTITPDNPRWRQPGFRERWRSETANVRLLAITDPRPRLYVANTAKPIATDRPSNEQINQIFGSPCQCAYVDDGPTIDHPTPAIMAVTPTTDSPESVTAMVSVETMSVLVLNRSMAPGWSVTVDGKPASLQTVNHRTMGVVLSPGVHQVSFRYRTPGLVSGGIGSAAGLLLSVFLLLRGRRDSAV
ncbi:MAG: YfhO family protein [Pseudomonadota bacterium]